MDLRKLKTLIDLVSESNVSELEITEADGKVRIVKAGAAPVVMTMPVAQHAAAMYRRLRGHGITVRSPIDLLVGAWCIRNDCLLIQDDRDFAGMQQIEGLQTT